MTDTELIGLAERSGFAAAVIGTQEVPTNGDFRKFCRDNLCGNYGANYSCPPSCGTPEQMRERIDAGTRALILKSEWPIDGYEDRDAIARGKAAHNTGMLRLAEKLQKAGYRTLVAGSSCCSLCTPCAMTTNGPCAHPELRFSCLSAYCVDVAELAKRCGMAFAWDTKKLYPYGMIVLGDKKEQL